jgi:hypothetical protein
MSKMFDIQLQRQRRGQPVPGLLDIQNDGLTLSVATDSLRIENLLERTKLRLLTSD